MTERRVHSSIDKLPADLRDALTRMLIDNIWPAGFEPARERDPKTGIDLPAGKPTYQDMCDYCAMEGYSISLSAMGRFGMQMRTLARMKNAGVIVRDVMKDLTAEKASETQKAVAEMITAQTIEFLADREEMDADEIRDVAKAIKDCTCVSINADKYIREQVKVKAEKVAANAKQSLADSGVDRKKIQAIVDEILGISKS
jgi:hypothetical protein